MADAVFLTLLILHVGSIVGWMGGAVLFVSVLSPSLRRMTPPSRTEFIRSTIPAYTRFVGATTIIAVLSGLLLYVYSTQIAPALGPSSSGLPYVQGGAIVALVVVIIAFAVTIPSSRKLVSFVKQGPPNDQTAAEVGGLQKRLGIAAQAGAGLLGLTLILMIIGASI
jgi:uncharacterized membrane protein